MNEKEPWENRPTLTHLLDVYEGEGLIGIQKLYESLLDAERAELVKVVEGMRETRTFMDADCRWCDRQFCDLDGNNCLQRVVYNQALDTVIEKIKNKV